MKIASGNCNTEYKRRNEVKLSVFIQVLSTRKKKEEEVEVDSFSRNINSHLSKTQEHGQMEDVPAPWKEFVVVK
jgi:hypothetical protein